MIFSSIDSHPGGDHKDAMTFHPTATAVTGILSVWLGLAASGQAQPLAPTLALSLPIDCEPGLTCWIPNFVDMDPGPGVQDYTCGSNAYNAHKGTDFAIANLRVMRKGIDVLAAAQGIVKGIRNNMPDVNFRWLDRTRLRGKECGNGTVIDHGNGWETQYCHLREGSVAVQKGQLVAPGDKLGLVGLSGLTEFPHLHLTLRHRGAVVDPFNGEGEECGVRGTNLWASDAQQQLSYQPSAVYNIGFATSKPNPHKARLGLYDTDRIAGPVETLFVTMEMFGAEPNDQIVVQLSTSDGHIIAQRRITITVNWRKARLFHATGFRDKKQSWSRGTLKADVEIFRKSDAGTWSFKGARKVTIN